MAMTTNAAAAPFGAITVHRATSALGSLVGMFQAWNNHRRTVRALRALSVDQLEDIGLTPADVENIGHKGF